MAELSHDANDAIKMPPKDVVRRLREVLAPAEYGALVSMAQAYLAEKSGWSRRWFLGASDSTVVATAFLEAGATDG
jgi:hypothetical protein